MNRAISLAALCILMLGQLSGCGSGAGQVIPPTPSPNPLPTPVPTQGLVEFPQPVISVVPPLNSATAAVYATAVVQRTATGQAAEATRAVLDAAQATVAAVEATAFAKQVPTMTAYAITGEQSTSPRVERGKPYPFVLYTHCGVDYDTDFDGSFWDVVEKNYAPRTLGDPDQKGTMTLTGDNTARFDFWWGSISYVRHVGPKIILHSCL